ncbi:hypothetical protein L211DRAFT_594201 [Terfezia boudieri ATCC MYA-4762]|uniref:Uncharacterized protein n=1 Tax=Terfezia boudieri ATCC MYA-4762 TaxID=1051890 RepID=A0A3N4LAN2_9PEZI|nr:hypothetical protein L211DRAFT_594201 [Terfezia boudieri ATCC MYA-4762]
MDNFLPGGFLQRPQTSGLDPMEFQFMPGPSPRAKPPQGKGSSSTHTTLDIVSLKPGAQTTPRSAAGLMMPPPCTPAEDSMEFSREMTRPWEGQNPSSNLISSSSHRRSLPRPEQSLNWRAVEGMRPPSRRRSATMGGISSHTSSISSLTVNPENASYQFKGDSVQSPREDETIEAKMAPATTSIATDTNQWGLDLLEMGFDLPEDIPSSAQKRDSIAISTSTELNRPKRKQARSLEFYETPQAKELETRLSELNSDKLVGKPSDNKIPEVIDLSDDDICFTLKQGLVEKPSSGRKVGNLIQQQQHKLREMQCHNEAPNHGRQERTLSLHSLHSSQGTVTPQPRHQPSLDAIQASRALQTVIQSGSCSLGQKSGSDLGTLSGEQQLSIALTHLAAEKTALEMKLSRVNQNYLQQSTELLTLKQENVGLRSENQKFKSAASSLRAQVSMVTEHVRVCGNDLSQLGEEAALLKAKVKGCIDDGIGIKQEIQKANMHTTSIAERIRKFEDPAHLVRDMELQRDQAQGTTSLLRKELNDIVGELSLARERVTTLETLLENAAQRTVKEKEQTEDVADILAEIKASCISGFEELQTLLKSILDANVGASAQASDMEKFLTCLVKTEVKEVVKKVNGVDNALKDIKQDMRQAEKRNRRVVLVGGVRVIDKLVTATEALEKLFRQECEGITKTVDDCLVQIRGDSTKQPEYIKAICNNLESVGERVKSIFTETKDIHNIAINDRKYISHLVGQNESLIERIKLLESKSEELAVLKINKIQVEKDLRESRDLCDRMSRELEGLKELGKENIKSIAYLEKQLEMALAMPKEDPSVIGTLRSTMENLDRSVESLLAMIADKEQQVVAKDRQIEALNAESLVLKKINEALKEKTGAFEEEREYESVLKRHYEEEKARYIQKVSLITLNSECYTDAHAQALDERNTERISVEQNAQRLCEKIRVEAQNSMKMFRTDNTKLQSELLELRGKLTECEKSVVGYVGPLV